MKRLTVWGWLGIMTILLFASCKSSKVATVNDLNGLEGEKFVEGVIANTPDCQTISAKMKFALNVNGQKISVGGNLRMKRDDVIQLSLVGFGFVEGGRIEFTKEDVLVIDRINRQYVRIPYSKLGFLKEAEIDFHTLQALFWNELIFPGKEHVTSSNASSFTVRKEENRAVLSGKSSRKLSYRFFASLSTGALEKTEISAKAPYGLNWNYQDFVPLDDKAFPSVMNIRLEGLEKPATVSIHLGNMSTDDNWETRTKVSKRYKEVTAEDILDRILRL